MFMSRERSSTMMYNAAILEAAGRHLGVKEWPGAKSNPIVEGFLAASGHPGLKDEVPWCAGFVGAVLAEIGHPGTNSLLARSYLEWGSKVNIKDAQAGDVVIFTRGAPPKGHVGFVVRFEGDYVLCRGGNQGDAVSDAWFPISQIIGIRRADGARVYKSRPTLHFGDRGAFVTDLQDQLKTLGYMVGNIDGHYGSRTREAVLAFQADNALATDAVIGPRTWEALDKAKPRPKRDVTLADLRERGSSTIAGAEKAQVGTAAAAGLSAATVAIEKAQEAAAAVQQATGVLDQAKYLVVTYWPVLIPIGLGLIVWKYLSDVKQARLRDAQEGRNVGL